MNTQQNISKAIFSVNAIVFGTDASILGVKLYDGFSFVRKSLMPLKDHLDEVFETDAMGLRREYELARFDDSLDVICITKNIELGQYRINATIRIIQQVPSKNCG